MTDHHQAIDDRLAGKAASAAKEEAAAPAHHPFARDHADGGLKSPPRKRYSPSAAFDGERNRPLLERSLKER